jgi:hypothetical protein
MVYVIDVHFIVDVTTDIIIIEIRKNIDDTNTKVELFISEVFTFHHSAKTVRIS